MTKNYFLFLNIILSILLPSNVVLARSQTYEGKCGFLLSNIFGEKCTALFNKDILTIMPKGGPQERIYPTQIESFSLSSKETIKVNQDLDKWQRLFPEQSKGFLFFKKKEGIPKWVVDATSKKVREHIFVINYVDNYLLPRKLLFILEDENQATAMQLSLRKTTGLYLGEKRKPGSSLSPSFSRKITREVERKAERIMGLCAAGLHEDSLPVISELNAYVDNTINEISIFENYEVIANKIDEDAIKTIAFCENKKVEDLTKASKAKRLSRVKEIEQRKGKRIDAFDMFRSY